MTREEYASGALELLARLSRNRIAIPDLLRDLNWGRTRLHNQLKQVRKMGLVVHVTRAAPGEIWLADESWQKADMMATAYVERTYGNSGWPLA